MGLKVTRGFSHVCLLLSGERQSPSLEDDEPWGEFSLAGTETTRAVSQAGSVGCCVLMCTALRSGGKCGH